MIGKLLINTVDRTTSVQFGSVAIRNNINSKVDTLEFEVLSYGALSFKPEVGQEVEYYLVDGLDEHKIFGGLITSVDETQDNHAVLRYTCECLDYTHELDRELVTERYESMTVAAIIADLLATYATDFTGTNVVGATTTVDTIAFNRIPLTVALERLARLTGFSWYVDYDKDLHFFPKNTESAPFALSDDGGNHILETLSIKHDLTQIRNRVFIQGGDYEGSSRSERLTGDGTKKEWPLVYRYAQQPTITVDGVAKTVLPDNLYTLTDADFLWSPEQQYLRSNTAWSSATNGIVVTGIPYIPIVVQVSDPVSIGTYGVWEFAEKDERIQSRDEAIQFAQTQLKAYRDGIREGGFITYEYGLRSGQTITISSTLRGINEDFLIQSVSFKSLAIDHHEWRVSLATARTIGIIDILQGLLLKETIEVDEDETLLTFAQFDDTALVAETVSVISDSAPYYYEDASGTSTPNPGMYDLSTWS